MPMPIELVLIRHGESEGNAAKRRSERGDNTDIAKLKGRHTASLRLTPKGVEQGKKAGNLIRQEFEPFDRHYVSEYVRAMETAVMLDLPGAEWMSDFYISERDWGDLDVLPEDERQQKFGSALKMRDVEPFFWRPPNGESFAQLCLRVDRILDTLARECGDKRVGIVCHGEVMWAFRIRLERMSQLRFKELHLSKKSEDRMHNCQILHYTRRSPEDGKLSQYYNWMEMIRPTEEPVWRSGWLPITRTRYTNEDLLRIVSYTKAEVA